jgi:SAM-dependent methyltransferase
MLGDMGGAWSLVTALIGDRLGLYRALMKCGPLTPAGLAKETGMSERYIREWLSAQAAAGFVDYDSATGTFELTPEQAMVFAVEESPVFMAGGLDVIASAYIDEPKISEAFRTGCGVGWGDHHPCMFRGVARFFRPQYINNLAQSWIPAVEGLEAKLKAGARVADVGCGHGMSTLIMAKAYPNSIFVGYDFHGPSVKEARKQAKAEGMDGRVAFEQAAAQELPGRDFDAAMMFDCLHDMGDPVGAAKGIRGALKKDGVWMIVEPYANDTLADNLNPVGRLYYAASTMICTPTSLSQNVGLALGAQAGEKRLREVVTAGGFTRFKRATETPFNLVLEARP